MHKQMTFLDMNDYASAQAYSRAATQPYSSTSLPHRKSVPGTNEGNTGVETGTKGAIHSSIRMFCPFSVGKTRPRAPRPRRDSGSSLSVSPPHTSPPHTSPPKASNRFYVGERGAYSPLPDIKGVRGIRIGARPPPPHSLPPDPYQSHARHFLETPATLQNMLEGMCEIDRVGRDRGGGRGERGPCADPDGVATIRACRGERGTQAKPTRRYDMACPDTSPVLAPDPKLKLIHISGNILAAIPTTSLAKSQHGHRRKRCLAPNCSKETAGNREVFSTLEAILEVHLH